MSTELINEIIVAIVSGIFIIIAALISRGYFERFLRREGLTYSSGRRIRCLISLALIVIVVVIAGLSARPSFKTYFLGGSKSTPTPLPIPINSPYQDAFIELISANPDLGTSLQAASDIRYRYTIRYYVPEFDWKRVGYEPRIILERVVSIAEGMETVSLNDMEPELG